MCFVAEGQFNYVIQLVWRLDLNRYILVSESFWKSQLKVIRVIPILICKSFVFIFVFFCVSCRPLELFVLPTRFSSTNICLFQIPVCPEQSKWTNYTNQIINLEQTLSNNWMYRREFGILCLITTQHLRPCTSRVIVNIQLLFVNLMRWGCISENIATGETSPAITPYHFFGDFNFFNFHH